ncbi:MAG: hypothetical protein ABUT20_23985 [Bacteroidota bacterium]
MRARLFTGWTFQRILFLVIGGFILTQSIIDRQWFGMIFGIYFASMGLFALGCAAGNCYGASSGFDNTKKAITSIPDVEYEEVK